MKSQPFEKIIIFGPGAWGSALGSVIKFKGMEPVFWGPEKSIAQFSSTLNSRTLVVVATPFKEIRSILKTLKGLKIAGLVNASKGIDRESLLTFSSLAQKNLKCPFATLSGPTFADELAQKKPTACVLAGKDKKFLTDVAAFFSTSYFRIYTSNDPLGVEICGAFKNVLAIACGISDGLHLGLNARAALLTRGLKEMESLVKALGGKTPTVYGLAGVGDLWMTATGDLSRNRQLGLKIATTDLTKNPIEKILSELSGPAEGFYSVTQAQTLAKKHRLDLPICEQIFKICLGEQNPKEALRELMTRELKPEDSSLSRRPRKASSKR